MSRPTKLQLAHLPTPLWHNAALDALVGCEVWVKRDDMTGGAEAGNKLRKLEYLLADALRSASTVVLTCGAVQSNHARATALSARGLGLGAVLLLRHSGDSAPPLQLGNALLDRLVGAELRLITPQQYASRDALLSEASASCRALGERPYVIPEGGSNGLGALGYVDAMAEVAAQLRAGQAGGSPFDAVVHAAGSGGTAAGLVLGARLHGVASEVWSIAVCDDAEYFERVTARICAEAELLDPTLSGRRAELRVFEHARGPSYGQCNDEQLSFIVQVARACGLMLDPVYTGKALFGLARLAQKPRRALFIHTGGLPGLLAEGPAFEATLAAG